MAVRDVSGEKEKKHTADVPEKHLLPRPFTPSTDCTFWGDYLSSVEAHCDWLDSAKVLKAACWGWGLYLKLSWMFRMLLSKTFCVCELSVALLNSSWIVVHSLFIPYVWYLGQCSLQFNSTWNVGEAGTCFW